MSKSVTQKHNGRSGLLWGVVVPLQEDMRRLEQVADRLGYRTPRCSASSPRSGAASPPGTTRCTFSRAATTAADYCPGFYAGLGLPSRRPPGPHPGLTGGLWLWMILVLSLFHAVMVPSGFRTTVQPHW
jgi:hypothetical protein